MLAHQFGDRGELPLPAYLITWGVGLALVLSFVALGTTWTAPRLARVSAGRPLAPSDAVAPLHLLGRAVAFAIYLVCLYAGFAGFDAPDRNILPVTVYVVVWVGAQLVAGLVGDLWGAINPIATLAQGAEGLSRLLGREPTGGPTGWGHWPAAAGLAVFLFYELSHPTGLFPATLAWLLVVHAGVTVVLGFLWGRAWVVGHEPFSVLFATIAAMGPLFDRRSQPGPRSQPGRLSQPGPQNEEGHRSQPGHRPALGVRPAIGVRPPLSGLSTVEFGAGTVMLFLVAIGGTVFDGFSGSELGFELFRGHFGWTLAWAEVGALIVSVTAVSGLYYAAVLWLSNSAGLSFDRSWREFGPVLVPVAFGFTVSHYFQLLVDESQSFVFRLSDPLGRGWDLFGGADGLIWRIDWGVVVWVQVAAILVGHVGAVVVANDRAVERLPPGRALQSQFVLLFVLIATSALGLWLLLTA